MLIRRKLAISLCLGLCLLLPNFILKTATAAEVNISMTCDNTTPVSGEEFVVNVVLKPSENTNVAAYRIRIKFDSTKLSYKGLYSDINYDDFSSYVKGDVLTVLYVTTDQGFNVSAGHSEVILELNFKVLSSCNVGSTTLVAQIDGLCDYDANEIAIIGIDPIDITVIQTGEAICDLASLAIDGYQLTPAFSPDVTQYSVDVPYSKSTVEFEATPLDDSATVKASRKTLKSAGTSTDVNLTVASADKKSKKVYTVTVNRLTKAETETKNLSKNEEQKSTDIDKENHTDSAPIENLADNNDDSSQNYDNKIYPTKAPMIVTQNSFNFVFFAIVAIVFLAVSIFFIKHKR